MITFFQSHANTFRVIQEKSDHTLHYGWIELKANGWRFIPNDESPILNATDLRQIADRLDEMNGAGHTIEIVEVDGEKFMQHNFFNP